MNPRTELDAVLARSLRSYEYEQTLAATLEASRDGYHFPPSRAELDAVLARSLRSYEYEQTLAATLEASARPPPSRRLDNPGGGDCLYYSVLRCLGRELTLANVRWLRNLVADFVETEADPAVLRDRNVENVGAFVERIRTDGAWYFDESDLVIQLVSAAARITFHLIFADRPQERIRLHARTQRRLFMRRPYNSQESQDASFRVSDLCILYNSALDADGRFRNGNHYVNYDDSG